MSSKYKLYCGISLHGRIHLIHTVYPGMRNYRSSALSLSEQLRRDIESKSKLDDLHSFTDVIVDATIKRDKSPSWNYPKIIGTQERRLKSDLQLSEIPNRVPSREYNEFFADTSESLPFEDSDSLSSEIVVEPGTFVELRRYVVVI